jgi:hypothetical protein
MNNNKKKPIIKEFFIVVLALSVALMCGCNIITADNSDGEENLGNQTQTKEDEPMKDNKNNNLQIMIPLDQSIPDNMETATLALG